MAASTADIGRVRIGGVPIDRLTMEEAVDAIDELVRAGRGGSVFTPNVDHIVQCQDDARLREAYEAVSLSLADGVPVVLASRLLGRAAPQKVSGSDLVGPLVRRAAHRGWRVVLVGGGDGIARRASASMTTDNPGLKIVGTLSPRVEVDAPAERRKALLDAIAVLRPDLVLVAFGAPKQEVWIHESRAALAPAVLLGVGATLDFLAGAVSRAPSWISRVGFEWLYRLVHEPHRLWRRYLLRDPMFLGVVLADLRRRRQSEAPSSR